MLKNTCLIALATIGMTSAIAHADDTASRQKFCDAMSTFHSDVKTLEGIGPNSTVAELRSSAQHVAMDAQDVQRTASNMKTPSATEFNDAAKKLHTDANALPPNTTIEQARTKLSDDIQRVKAAGRKLNAEAGCSQQGQQGTMQQDNAPMQNQPSQKDSTDQQQQQQGTP